MVADEAVSKAATEPLMMLGAASDEKCREILDFLRRNNLTDTEELLVRELSKRRTDGSATDASDLRQRSHSVDFKADSLCSGSSTSGGLNYRRAYKYLIMLINRAPSDDYRRELCLVLYPVFVHIYFDLVVRNRSADAVAFMREFSGMQESFYSDDIQKISLVDSLFSLDHNADAVRIRTSRFVVRICRDAYEYLCQKDRNTRPLFGRDDASQDIIDDVIRDHLTIDVYSGQPRSAEQIADVTGSMLGEASRQANKVKVYYGVYREPDVSGFLNAYDALDANADEATAPDGSVRKRRVRKEMGDLRRLRNDAAAPPPNRVPMLDARDSDKMDRVRALKEFTRRQRLSAGGSSSSPSTSTVTFAADSGDASAAAPAAADCDPGKLTACFYTLTNSGDTATCSDFTDDSSMLALGFDNAEIRVWSLMAQKLKALKSAEALAELDPDTDDVLHRMMDEASATTCKVLRGHSAPIYDLSFSSDKCLLLSASHDGCIRLWSLQTWSCVVVYRGHILPVFAVRFASSNSGCTGPAASFYFASGGRDTTARLWSTESVAPLRIFVGHAAPVARVAVHPNCHYIASAAHDRQIRLWECHTGNCVRLMTGHKGSIGSLLFSANGRLLFSGGSNRSSHSLTISGDSANNGSATASEKQQRSGGGGEATPSATSTALHDDCYKSNMMSIIAWDMSTGRQVGHFAQCPRACHPRFADPTAIDMRPSHGIVSLATSRETSVLVSGATDGSIGVWNIAPLVSRYEAHGSSASSASTAPSSSASTASAAASTTGSTSHGGVSAGGGGSSVSGVTTNDDDIANGGASNESSSIMRADNVTPMGDKAATSCYLKTFYTKETPVVGLHFTRRNLLLGVGPFRKS